MKLCLSAKKTIQVIQTKELMVTFPMTPFLLEIAALISSGNLLPLLATKLMSIEILCLISYNPLWVSTKQLQIMYSYFSENDEDWPFGKLFWQSGRVMWSLSKQNSLHLIRCLYSAFECIWHDATYVIGFHNFVKMGFWEWQHNHFECIAYFESLIKSFEW